MISIVVVWERRRCIETVVRLVIPLINGAHRRYSTARRAAPVSWPRRHAALGPSGCLMTTRNPCGLRARATSLPRQVLKQCRGGKPHGGSAGHHAARQERRGGDRYWVANRSPGTCASLKAEEADPLGQGICSSHSQPVPEQQRDNTTAMAAPLACHHFPRSKGTRWHQKP
jgi:hypothetical protein